MVLGEPGDRVAELVGEPRLLRDLGKYLHCRLFGITRPHQIEDAEFHRPLLRFARASVAAAIRGVKLPRLVGSPRQQGGIGARSARSCAWSEQACSRSP